MKRKYEFQSKTSGLTLQVEESACPDTITLSIGYMREEILAMCLSREDWMVLRQIGESTPYSQLPFAWAEVTK